MTVLKNTLCKAESFVRAYKVAKAHSIYELYKKPSSAKVAAYKRLIRQLPAESLDTVRIWGNEFVFTFAYLSNDGLNVVTPTYSYLIPQED